MEWRVREAGVEDVEGLALVGAATFLDTFAGTLDGAAIVAHCAREHSVGAYRRLLEAGAAAWLAEAAEGGAPVGYALLTEPALPGTRAGDRELKRIYALARLQGSGLGAELLRRVVAHSEREGALRLLLGVHVGNGRALAFYGKHGFTPVAERRFRVGEREYDDVVLAKVLASSARVPAEPA